MMPLVTIGPLRLSSYGVVLMLMTMGWWWWCARRIYRATQRDADALLMQLVVGAWLGGRLWVALGTQALFVELSNLRSLEFAWSGACVGASSALALAARRSHWQPFQLVSLIAVPTLLAQAGGAVGMYIAGMGMGSVWDGWWAVDMAGMLRHPVQLYEASVALVGAGVCVLVSMRRPAVLPHAFMAALASNWMLVEGFRARAWTLPGGIHVAQVVALVLLIVVIERVMMALKHAHI